MNRFTIIALTTVLFLSACKKDKDQPPKPPADTFRLQFNGQTIPFSQVDSAVVLFHKEGSNNPVFQRLIKGANHWQTSIDGLSAGKYRAELYVYAQLADGNATTSGRYQLDKKFTIPYREDSLVVVAGPGAGPQDPWEKFIVLADPDHSVLLTVPLNPKNPYFEFLLQDTRWDQFQLERIAAKYGNGGNEFIAIHAWECPGSCYGADRIISNSTAFLPFVETLGSKAWDNAEVSGWVANSGTGEKVEFFYQYDR
ncbi:MAG: hypothetical protein P0Y53_25195 [Candidatus Pseudobacter hemicellulosilyticus]|uniref:Uncharacterized protein n=1 Tax=Candidatus Pseudobacter hemicellulosilyticus TaxID=3121375 RepID=A0AAJ6BI18_9BACT|nr:MAG: hypothetical protein P0Y53_25195 [Pseudobacter sp.]